MNEEYVVRTEGLSAILGGRTVLEDVTLSIRAGSFTGLIGPNGAGKSTLLKILLGLIHPSAGTALVFGLPPGEAHHLIGYVPQGQTGVDNNFPVSVRDVVMMGRLSPARFPGFYSRADGAAADGAINSVGLATFAGKRFGSLSGGERQKALIARALCGGPRLLLLDEPSSGVDVVAQDGFHAMLMDLKAAYDVSILLVSHDVGVITSMVDNLICLNQRVFLHGPPDEAVKDGMIGRAYGSKTEIVMHGHDVPHRHLRRHGDGDGAQERKP
jgi:zinc transport system ATP-binding protein